MNTRRLVRRVVIVTLLAMLVSLALPALAQFPTQQVATVTAWRLNVRAAPGIYARILAVISRYEVYPVVNSLLQDGSVVAVNPYRGYWWTAS